LAWTAGDKCRDASELCDNDASLAHAGNLGWAGIVFVALGNTLLLAYQFLHKSRPMGNALMASLACLSLAWVILLLSWVIFTIAVGGDVECTILDVSNTGAIVATGSFGDIINERGSYSYGFVLGSWCFLTFVIAGVAKRVMYERAKSKNGEPAETSTAVAEQPAAKEEPQQVPEQPAQEQSQKEPEQQQEESEL
jgi:hypothetical protein